MFDYWAIVLFSPGADLGGGGGRPGSAPLPFGRELTLFNHARTHLNTSNGNNNVKKVAFGEFSW